MITMTRPMANNYSQLKFNRNKNSKNSNTDVPQQPVNKGNSKLSTGVLVTSAFLAGLGTGHVTAPITQAKSTEIHANKPDAANNESTIAWSDAVQQQQQNKNIPPKDDYRYWTTTEQKIDAGKKYNITKTYYVKEEPTLVESEYKDAQTNKLIQKTVYTEHLIFPSEYKTTDAKGNIIQTKKVEDFNYDICCPTKTTIQERYLSKDPDQPDQMITRNITFQVKEKLDYKNVPSINKPQGNKPQGTNSKKDIDALIQGIGGFF